MLDGSKLDENNRYILKANSSVGAGSGRETSVGTRVDRKRIGADWALVEASPREMNAQKVADHRSVQGSQSLKVVDLRLGEEHRRYHQLSWFACA